MKKALLFSTFLLSACGISNEFLMKAPDGTPIYRAECNYSNNSMADCYKEANKTCPLGIIVLKFNESFTPIVSTFSDVNIKGNTSVSGDVMYNNMISQATFNANSSSKYNAYGAANTIYGKIIYRELIYACKIKPE